jgi:hypothetical protein
MVSTLIVVVLARRTVTDGDYEADQSRDGVRQAGRVLSWFSAPFAEHAL